MANKLNIGTVFVSLLLEDGNFGPDLKKAEAAMASFGSKATDIAATVDRFITRAFMAAAAAVTSVATAAAVTGAAFEKEMSRVAAISGATAEEMAALTEEARRIGSETLFSATEAAKGMEALAQAGFTPRQIITATADAMNLAGASGMELGKATELVAASITQFGLKAEDAGRVSDVLTQAASSSLFTMEDLAVAMRYAGAAGASMGYSLEETTAAVAQFRNAGLTGEQAGTNFRGMLEAIANPSIKAMDAIASLGLTVEDLNPALHSFDEIMQTLHDANLDVANSFRIFGTVSGANVARLSAQWEDAKLKQTGYTQTLDALMRSQGVAGAQFASMADNVSGRFDRMSSEIEDALLTIFDAMKGPLSRLMDELTERIGFLTRKFMDSSGEVEDGLDRLVDGILAIVDQIIVLTPYLETIGTLMFAALVGAKGVQWAGAAASLASAFGVDLAGAAAKAATAIRAAGAAASLFTATGVGAVVAGLALLTAAVGKLWFEYTGATHAARTLKGELAGQASASESAKAEQAALGEVLKTQQEVIRARVEAGEVLSKEENQLLRMNAATAYQAKLAGELLDVGGELQFLSQVSTETKKNEVAALEDSAVAAEQAAERLGFLASQYQAAGFSETVNDKVMQFAGVIGKANEEFGTQFESLEDLTQAQTEYALAAEQARKTAEKLTAALTDEKIAANEANAALSGGPSGPAPTADTFRDFQDQLRGAERAADASADRAIKLKESVQELAELTRTLGKTLSVDMVTSTLDNAVIRQKMQENWQDAVVNAPVPADAFARAGDRLNEVYEENARLALEKAAKRAEIKSTISDALNRAAKEFGDRLKKAMAGAGEALFKTLTAGLGSMSGIGGLIMDLTGRRAQGAEDLASAKSGVRDAQSGVQEARRKLAKAKREAELAGEGESGASARAGVRAAERNLAESRLAVGEAQGGLATARKESRVDGRSMVDEAVDAALAFIQTLAEELPGIIDRITERMPEIANALAKAIPVVVRAVVQRLPALIDALMNAIPKLINAAADAIILLLINAPRIITAILRKIPKIINAVVERIPGIITAIVRATPLIIGAIINQLPRIGMELLLLGPKLVVGMVREIISGRFFKALWEGFKKLAKDFTSKIVDYLTLGLSNIFRKTPNKDKKGVAGLFQDIGRLFSKKGRNRHPDGIPYVPHTMSTVLEPGEAVLTAMDNWERRRTNLGTPGPLPRGSGRGGGANVEVTVAWDGHVMDAAQSESMADGRMPRVRRAMRSAARNSRIGFSLGPLSTRG